MYIHHHDRTRYPVECVRTARLPHALRAFPDVTGLRRRRCFFSLLHLEGTTGPAGSQLLESNSLRCDVAVGSALMYSPHHACVADVLSHLFAEEGGCRAAYVVQLSTRRAPLPPRLSRWRLSTALILPWVSFSQRGFIERAEIARVFLLACAKMVSYAVYNLRIRREYIGHSLCRGDAVYLYINYIYRS